MKKLIIIGATILSLLLLAYFFTRPSLPKLKQATIYKASSTAANARFPYLADASTIDFFTGTSFAAYNATTGATTNLSPQFNLPIINTMRWSKTGVLFEAGNYSTSDDLYPAITARGLFTGRDYWWLYSFQNQKVTLVLPPNKLGLVLPADPAVNTLDAFWNSSTSEYAFISNTHGVFVSNNPKRQVYQASSGAKIIQFSGNYMYLSDNKKLIRIDIASGHADTIISADFQNPYVSPDGQTISYTLSPHAAAHSDVPGDLFALDPTTFKSRRLLPLFSGVTAGSKGNLYAAYTDSKGAVRLDFYPNKATGVEYNVGPVLERDATVATILPAGSGTVYIGSNHNHLVRATSQPTSSSNPINYTYQLQTDLYLDGFEIHYDPSKDSYVIRINKNPYIQYQNAALGYIRSKGVDPNQINITWSPGDGVNNVNPAVDKTPSPDFVPH